MSILVSVIALVTVQAVSLVAPYKYSDLLTYLLTWLQGWVFAMAKSIFARAVVKTGEKTAKTATYKIVRNTPIGVINEIF